MENSVIFNGNDLSLLSGGDLYNHNFTRLPIRDIRIHKLARESLSIITSAEYTQKELTVWLDICRGSREATEMALEELKAILQGQNGELRVRQAGTLYKYTATMNELSIEWDGYNAYATISFIASTPIGESVDSLPMFNFSLTSQYANTPFTVAGSFAAKPTITAVVNDIAGAGELTLQNSATGQGIKITEPLSPGDTLEINSEQKSVTLNGEQIDFAGLFPEFPAGSQQVEVISEYTLNNIDIAAVYNKRIA